MAVQSIYDHILVDGYGEIYGIPVHAQNDKHTATYTYIRCMMDDAPIPWFDWLLIVFVDYSTFRICTYSARCSQKTKLCW